MDSRSAKAAEIARLRAALREAEAQARVGIADIYAGVSQIKCYLERVASCCAAALASGDGAGESPCVVCLCGSTRFKSAYEAANKQETIAGRIVLSVGCFPHTDDGGHAEQVLGEDVKARLDVLHKRKIDLADEVLVLNVGGYIGSSTRGEIDHALATGKPVRYWEERP